MTLSSNTSKRKEASRYYKVKLIWYRMRHGMILFSIRNLLLRLKINLNPYWIEREGLNFCSEPTLGQAQTPYSVKKLEKGHLHEIFGSLKYSTKDLKENPNSPYDALGLFQNDQLAAFMMIRFNQFTLNGKVFKLKPGEAYLENMYTFENFRGKKLAPYLRYKCYEYLEEQGVAVCYSVTEYLNNASRRFKTKLNVKHQALYLHVDLFKKFKRTYLLRKY
ncbi:GNAT family N-acetyltransferase [Robiginitalea sp. SC105]|uniref:GNAT family N-acetyltransferase n=1 Tax=Robiginitalea sp. SC105 TaxID=2762332 RepID=UPI00163AA623|nr:GNAT family N-acetyltransferase [Robiginitalea sp. SC105]MBC2839930.1 GNAT family N-acetyltransferase [Robiginitalea sp. SC105]